MTRTLFRVASICVLIAIWVLSLIPAVNVPDAPGNDKLHHALAYFTCMFCWGQLYVQPVQRIKLAIILVAMGALIECIQYFTPTRSFEFLDMLANATGVTLAWIVVTIQLAIQRRLAKGFSRDRPADK